MEYGRVISHDHHLRPYQNGQAENMEAIPAVFERRENVKEITSKNLDEVMRLTRKYFKTGDTDILGARYTAAEACSIDLFGYKSEWLAVCEITSSILNGLKKSASNKDVYAVLRVLGYKVVGEPETDDTDEQHA
jgi:hypothetical protein